MAEGFQEGSFHENEHKGYFHLKLKLHFGSHQMEVE